MVQKLRPALSILLLLVVSSLGEWRGLPQANKMVKSNGEHFNINDLYPDLSTIPITERNMNEAPNHPNISEDCTYSLALFLKESYPNQTYMLVATGLGVGEVGFYDMCQDLTNAHYCCLNYQLNGASELTWRNGLCVPTNCTQADMQIASLYFLPNLAKYINANTSVVMCADKQAVPLSNSAIVLVSVFCLLFFMVILGTLVDYRQYLKETAEKKDFLDPLSSAINGEHANLIPNGSQKPLVGRPPRRVSKTITFFLAFSPLTNLGKLIQPTAVPHLESLNGLRAVSMIWIILGHTPFYALFITGYNNMLQVLTYDMKSVPAQMIVNATLAVDPFFYLSGFLVAYLSLGEMKKRGKLNLFLYYFHRIWRLSPAYYMAIFVVYILVPHLGQGPWWSGIYTYTEVANCEQYWWTNMLYINNFYPTDYDTQCMGWGWYLANDFQMYIFGPIFIYSYHRSKKLGIIILSLCIIGSMVARGVISWYNNFSPYIVAMQFDSDYESYLYAKPYTRCTPFLIGIGFAWLLAHHEEQKKEGTFPRIPLMGWMAIWGFALFLIIYPLFGPLSMYQDPTSWTKGAQVAYLTFDRPMFVLGIAILLHCCFLGEGYFFKTFLESPLWTVPARLTYSAYLYHPVIITVYFFSSTELFHYDPASVMLHFFGFAVGAFVLSLFSYLTIERPMMNLEKLLLPPSRH